MDEVGVRLPVGPHFDSLCSLSVNLCKIMPTQKLYRNVGIGLLVASIVSFFTLNFYALLGLTTALIFQAKFYVNPVWLFFAIDSQSTYQIFLRAAQFSLENIINIWAIVVSIWLIKNNRYTKQLLYIFHSWAGMNLFFFMLYIPLKIFLVFDLATSLVMYKILINGKNRYSQIINPGNSTKFNAPE